MPALPPTALKHIYETASNVRKQNYAASYAGSVVFSSSYPQLALWARRISPASLACIHVVHSFSPTQQSIMASSAHLLPVGLLSRGSRTLGDVFAASPRRFE